ncbi:MAG: radical SAM protein [Candidatus Omnitrophota bacterium]
MQEAKFACGEIAKYFKPAGLDSLVHFVTYKCNARCAHCFFSKQLNKEGELSRDEIFRMIGKLGKLKGLLISGGEPFLRDDLAGIVAEYALRCGVAVASIPTNGFNTDRIIGACETILGKCKNLNLTVAVSIDALHDDHDRRRGFPGGFARAAETARTLVELKKAYPRLRVHIVTVIMPDNAKTVRAVSGFVRDRIDPDYHWFEPMRRLSGKSLPLEGIAPDELRRFLNENIIYYFKKIKGSSQNIYSSRRLNNAIINFALNNLNIALDNFLDGKRWPVKCVAGRRIAVLYPDGAVSACELREPVATVRDFGYDLRRLLKDYKFKDEVRDISKGNCSCFHGCFIPPSVRFDPLQMGRLAFKTLFTKY